MFVKHVPITEPSWKVTLIAGLYVLNNIHLVQGVQPFIYSLFMELGLGVFHNYLLILGPIYILG